MVDALREAGDFSVSLVAEEDGEITRTLVSPVRVGGTFQGWYGYPAARHPPSPTRSRPRASPGAAGLGRLEGLQALGCVVLGEPAYYSRFGFRSEPGLRLEGFPPSSFSALNFGPEVPSGVVEYHQAFSDVG